MKRDTVRFHVTLGAGTKQILECEARRLGISLSSLIAYILGTYARHYGRTHPGKVQDAIIQVMNVPDEVPSAVCSP